MDNHVMQIIPGSAPDRCETAFGKGGSIMNKNMPREVIETKLQLAKIELETAGFIHSRDLRKHIYRLEKMLKRMKPE